MILSKLTTANKRDAMAAPEIRARAMIRSRDDVFATVRGDTFDGSVYAFAGVAMATITLVSSLDRREGKERKGLG